jgi:hypothetical protein
MATPTPEVKTILICRQIVQDLLDHSYVLIGPIHDARAARFPALFELSIFAELASARGSYKLGVRLRDMDGDELARYEARAPFVCRDPLKIGGISLRYYKFTLPKPGKYEFALTANGEEIATTVFWVFGPKGPRG